MRVLFCLSLLATGCASTGAYQRFTAGFIGCPANEITIFNRNGGFGSNYWEAECRGRKFICSGAGRVGNCTEQVTPVAKTSK